MGLILCAQVLVMPLNLHSEYVTSLALVFKLHYLGK